MKLLPKVLQEDDGANVAKQKDDDESKHADDLTDSDDDPEMPPLESQTGEDELKTESENSDFEIITS